MHKLGEGIENFQVGSAEWEKTYPRVLKRTLVKAVKDESDRFLKQVRVVNSMRDLIQDREKL